MSSHNPKVVGSNPTPATIYEKPYHRFTTKRRQRAAFVFWTCGKFFIESCHSPASLPPAEQLLSPALRLLLRRHPFRRECRCQPLCSSVNGREAPGPSSRLE